MANSLVVQGAIFAVGALVGGGIATAVARKNEAISPLNATFPQPPVAPILQVGTTGNPVIAPNVDVAHPPLKYGNPGMLCEGLCYLVKNNSHVRHQARLPTNSSAKRMSQVTIGG